MDHFRSVHHGSIDLTITLPYGPADIDLAGFPDRIHWPGPPDQLSGSTWAPGHIALFGPDFYLQVKTLNFILLKNDHFSEIFGKSIISIVCFFIDHEPVQLASSSMGRILASPGSW
ncbi:hypothetical protein ES705_14973 [subsurface metagenome]